MRGMRVRKLLRRRVVMREFADRARFRAETSSAPKWVRSPVISGVECGSSRAEAKPSPSRRGLKRLSTLIAASLRRSNTVPIEKGTETRRSRCRNSRRATPSPSRRGLKRSPSGTRERSNTVPIEKGTETRVLPTAHETTEATPSPSRRGLKPMIDNEVRDSDLGEATPSPSRRGLKLKNGCASEGTKAGSNTVPIEKGTETRTAGARSSRDLTRSNTVPIEKGTETAGKAMPAEICLRSNTVPIEKGTETRYSLALSQPTAEATPSPSRRGLKHKSRRSRRRLDEATPSPSRRGLKPTDSVSRSEDAREATPSPSRRGLKHKLMSWLSGLAGKQHRPHREGD